MPFYKLSDNSLLSKKFEKLKKGDIDLDADWETIDWSVYELKENYHSTFYL